jgi:hypothetical protein
MLWFMVLLLVTVVCAPALRQWIGKQSAAVQTQVAPLDPLLNISSAFAVADCQTYLLILVVDESGIGHIRAINSGATSVDGQLANLYLDASLTPFGGPYAVPSVAAGQTSSDASPLVLGLPEGQHSYQLVGSNGCEGQDRYSYLPARLQSLITNACEEYTYKLSFLSNGLAGPRTVWITRDTLNDDLQITGTENFGPFVFSGADTVLNFYLETRSLPVRAQWSARMFSGSTQLQNDSARTYILPCQGSAVPEPTATDTSTPEETSTPVPPTATLVPTDTQVPPTATSTATDVPAATDTVLPPTNTDTSTPTEVPYTLVPATATQIPAEPTATSTPVEPNLTVTVENTLVPTSTPTPSATASALLPSVTATGPAPGNEIGQLTARANSRFAICTGLVAAELVGQAYFVVDMSGQVLGPQPWGVVEWKPGIGAQVWFGFDPILSGMSGQVVMVNGHVIGQPVLQFVFLPNGSGTDNCEFSPVTELAE